jgi:plasmid stability protein
MASFQVRDLDDDVFLVLKTLALADGKRGVGAYVRELLMDQVKKPRKNFAKDIKNNHALIRKVMGGKLKINSTDLIREDRDNS